MEVPVDLALHNTLLRKHEMVYDELRPHQALGYLTPNGFVARCKLILAEGEKVSRIY